jgi:pimeloyl-ACP methyl ester carboxylesterase
MNITVAEKKERLIRASWTRRPIPLILLLVLAASSGCATPIGVQRVNPRDAYEELTRSALNSKEYSGSTQLVLHRYGMEKRFEKEPAATLRVLHEKACADDRRDMVCALAELNYAYADRLRRNCRSADRRQARDYCLCSAIYAYQYLLGEGSEAPPGPFDPGFRLACDLYNRALSLGLTTEGAADGMVFLTSGRRDLPPGPVDVQFTKPTFKWKLEEIEKFFPADDYLVRGLAVRNRTYGLGAPLIGVWRDPENIKETRRIPATVFLRVNGDLGSWDAGRTRVSLELHSGSEEGSVEVAGKSIPLETDSTAPIAHKLNEGYVWKIGKAQFLSDEQKIRTGIYLMQPYEPGRVPVVFVHGTFSSPVAWAEMWNTLQADSLLRQRCQFWYFVYNSGNPVTYSAANLRGAIRNTLERIDPEEKDPALHEMVIIGHSQGGLLTKLTAVDTGDMLWRAVSDQGFDDVKLSPDAREELRRNFFVTPLACVKRVVFISTPHRGSYLATSLVRKIAGRFVTLPGEVTRTSLELVSLRQQLNLPSEVRDGVPTSLDTMSPKNRVMIALADIPVAPGIKAHSIIPVEGQGEPDKGKDGVVAYASAHVPYVESEFIVRGVHSCQGQPETIEEVRRILLEHLAAVPVPHRTARQSAQRE